MLAQHCFVMCALPHLSQTVRCGTSRQLATDTCDGGFVQTFPFPLCGESPGTRDPHSKVHQVGFPPRAGVCFRSPWGLGDGEAQLARRPEAHSAPVAKTRQTRRDTQDSDAPHTTELTTLHCPTPRSCVSHSSLRLVVCRPAVSCHSWYHSVSSARSVA